MVVFAFANAERPKERGKEVPAKPRPLHLTTSLFIRSIPPEVSKEEITAVRGHTHTHTQRMLSLCCLCMFRSYCTHFFMWYVQSVKCAQAAPLTWLFFSVKSQVPRLPAGGTV